MKTCCRCKTEKENVRYVNFMHGYVCSDCYKDWMRKEENYYDFCLATETEYKRRAQSSTNDKNKFYKD